MKTLEQFKSQTVSAAAAYGVRSWHASLVFNNRMWVMAGRGYGIHNDVWASEDGCNWEMITAEGPFTVRRHPAATVFENKIWIAGGRSGFLADDQSLNDVWFSENGEDWTAATLKANFTNRFGHTLNAFNGQLWIIGGFEKSKIWVADAISASDDGTYWFPINEIPAFGNRAYHTTLEHNDRLWVIGGVGASVLGPNTTGNAEVWYTDNGYHWMLASKEAGFPPRFGHTAVSDGNHIYLIGGSNPNENHHHLNDIWRSHNGTDWEEIKVTDPPLKRLGHTSLYFKNHIWAIDGAQFTFKEQTDSASITTIESISNIWAMSL